jgi:DNA-binding MltR family transcriptional regulator
MFEFREAERLEIASSTDRAAAILCATYVDSAMETLLRGVMVYEVPNAKTGRLKDVFGYGPCGSYSNKNLLCYALGLISLNLHTDIAIIGEVRNKFAHNNEIASFDHPTIAKLIDGKFTVATVGTRMGGALEKREVSRRERFLHAASEIAVPLTRRRNRPEFTPLDW